MGSVEFPTPYWLGHWRPTIGDPSFIGWFTVGSYFFCAAIALVAVYLSQREGKAFRFWMAVTLLMVLLGINKQLDLQSLLTEIGREMARAQGWMAQRRTVQFWFIITFTVAATAAFAASAVVMGNLFKRFRLAFCGIFFLLSFIVIRAASFHHIDEILGVEFFGERVNCLLELTGIYLIALAGFREIMAHRKSQRH